MSANIAQNAEPAPAELAYHDPKQAPTLARLERLVGHSDSSGSPGGASPAAAESPRETPYPSVSHGVGGSLGPVDPTKVRAAIGTFEVAPVQELPPTALAGTPATRGPLPPRRDASRTRSEACLAFRTPLVGGEDGVDDRRFSVSDSPGGVGRVLAENRRAFSALDVTSGLPDDSREQDQRARTLVERQRQGRVMAAQEALKAHPEARELVMRDQNRLRMLCARFGVTPQDLCPHAETDGARIVHPGSPRDGMCGRCHRRHGWQPIHVADAEEVLAAPYDWMSEVRAREAAVFPGSE